MTPIVVSSIVLGLLGLRAFSIARAIVWIVQHGAEFRERFIALSPAARANPAVRYDLYTSTRANVFPFGVKTYLLHRWTTGGTNTVGRILRLPARAFQVAWSYFFFAPLCSIYFVIVANWHHSRCIDETQDVLTLIAGVLLMLCSIIIAIEAFVSFVVLRSYAVAHHGWNASKPNDRRLFGEIAVFAGQIIIAFMAATGVLYYVTVRFGGFQSMNWHVTSVTSAFARLGDCLYIVVVAFCSFGDGGASGGPAKLVIALMGILGPAYMVVIFAIVIGISATWLEVTPPAVTTPTTATVQPAVAPSSVSSTKPRHRRGAQIAGVAAGMTIAAAIWVGVESGKRVERRAREMILRRQQQ